MSSVDDIDNTLIPLVGIYTVTAIFENSLKLPSKPKPYGQAVTLLGRSPGETLAHMYQEIVKRIYTATLLIIANTLKQHTCTCPT